MIGFDYSMSSPAMCVTHKGTFEIHFVTAKKKFKDFFAEQSGFRVYGHYYDHKKEGHEDIQRFGTIAGKFLEILRHHHFDTDPVGLAYFEAYAFGAKGMLANIGECTGIMKHELVKMGFRIETISPTSVKKYASGAGNAKKEDMAEAFKNQNGFYIHDLLGCKIGDSPASDVVDAYYVYLSGKMDDFSNGLLRNPK
uniref:RuvC-like Holliday junction resolvase n=1 Tax=Rhizobium phage IG49 TaxID=3129228 RepID=A0AAU8HZB8_9CAUD